MPTRQALHAYRGTIPGVQTGHPIILNPGPPPNPFYPIAGQTATLCNIDLAEFGNTALVVCGPASNYQLIGGAAHPGDEGAEIVGVLSWGSPQAFSTAYFDWRGGTTISIAADFITIGAYVNQLFPNQTDSVVSDLLTVDLTVSLGPSPGHQNRLQRTLARYNQNPAGPLHFQPWSPGGVFTFLAPPFATQVRPVVSPGTTWKITITGFAGVDAEYTIASGTTAAYPLPDSSAQLIPGASVSALCLAGTGFCRLIFDLDV